MKKPLYYHKTGGRGGRTVAARSSCDAGPLVVVEANGRRRVHGLCDPRQHREQLLLTSNTSRVTVYFASATDNTAGAAADLLYRPTAAKQPQRQLASGVSHSSSNFIMKLEGTTVQNSYIVAHHVIRIFVRYVYYLWEN